MNMYSWDVPVDYGVISISVLANDVEEAREKVRAGKKDAPYGYWSDIEAEINSRPSMAHLHIVWYLE